MKRPSWRLIEKCLGGVYWILGIYWFTAGSLGLLAQATKDHPNLPLAALCTLEALGGPAYTVWLTGRVKRTKKYNREIGWQRDLNEMLSTTNDAFLGRIYDMRNYPNGEVDKAKFDELIHAVWAVRAPLLEESDD